MRKGGGDYIPLTDIRAVLPVAWFLAWIAVIVSGMGVSLFAHVMGGMSFVWILANIRSWILLTKKSAKVFQ